MVTQSEQDTLVNVSVRRATVARACCWYAPLMYMLAACLCAALCLLVVNTQAYAAGESEQPLSMDGTAGASSDTTVPGAVVPAKTNASTSAGTGTTAKTDVVAQSGTADVNALGVGVGAAGADAANMNSGTTGVGSGVVESGMNSVPGADANNAGADANNVGTDANAAATQAGGQSVKANAASTTPQPEASTLSNAKASATSTPVAATTNTSTTLGAPANTSTTAAPVPGAAAGSAYVEGDEATVYENTETANAIQRALDALLAKADGGDVKTYTIVVNDGTYTGGLSITKYYTVVDASGNVTTKTYVLPSDFVLSIVYVGVRGETGDNRAEASAGAVLQGDVVVDGINTTIAGLHLADRNNVEVSNADAFEFYGTKENDDIAVTLNNVQTSTIVMGAGNDVVALRGVTSGGAASGSVALRGGAGDDLLNIDASLHATADTVQVSGGAGGDMLHLTGTLANTAGVNNISGNAQALQLFAAQVAKTQALTFTIADIEAYTDALEGKTRVNLVVSDGSATFENMVFENFTDYVVDADRIVYLKITGSGDAFLSNLKLNASNISYIYAPALTVLVQAKNITVGDDATITAASLGLAEGEQLGITARSIRLEAYDTEDAVLRLVTQKFIGTDITLDFSLFDATAKAFVRIGGDAALKATETLYLSATTVQRGALDVGLLDDTGGWFNSVVVKVGSASVDVAGTLSAGGNVIIEALGVIDVVADSSDVADIAAPLPLGFPLAVVVGVLDTKVTLDGAALQAGGSVMARALSDVSLRAVATNGALPVSLAVGVGVLDTAVKVQDSSIIAAHDVLLHAASTLQAHSATSLPASGSSAHDSGGFFTVNVMLNNATAAIARSQVQAEGNVTVFAQAYQLVDTEAVARPMATTSADSLKQFTVAQTLRLVPELLGTVVGSVTELVTGDFAAAGAKITDACQTLYSGTEAGQSSSIDKIIDTAVTVAVDPGSLVGVPSATQLVGALAVSVTNNNAKAVLDEGAQVIAAQSATIKARALSNVATVSDATPIAKLHALKSAGAAASVAVVNHNAQALVSNKASVQARRVQVEAASPLIASEARAEAEYSNGDSLGVAGAIAVQVVSATTKAELASGSTVQAGAGGLAVTSDARTRFVTISDAANKGLSNVNGKGLGAGIAVAVIGNDVIARIADGAQVEPTEGASTLGNLDVVARHDGIEYLLAQAGAAGDTAITPVIGVSASGTYAEASVGSGADLPVLGAVNVLASNDLLRMLVTSGATTGDAASYGGSFSVTVYRDSTKAWVNRSVKAKSMKVHAKGISRAQTSARAGTSGAADPSDSGSVSEGGDPSPEDDPAGSADKQADNILAAIVNLSREVQTFTINPNDINQAIFGRQLAQTIEGDAGYAAAFALNIQNHDVLASVGDGLTFIITEDFTLLAEGDVDVLLKGDASTSQSSKGIGVGIAINIIKYNVHATFGASEAQVGGDFVICAITGADEGEATGTNTIKTYAIAGAGAQDSGLAGSIAIAVITGTTEARISDRGSATANDINVAKTLSVRAEGANAIDTVATARVTDTGEPDRNPDAERDANNTDHSALHEEGGTSGGGTDVDLDLLKSTGRGAGFAFNYLDFTTTAEVGALRHIQAAAFDLHSTVNNTIECIAVAGVDSMADTSTTQETEAGTPKTSAIDASAAVNVLQAHTNANFAAGSTLVTTGGNVVLWTGASLPAYNVVVVASTTGSTTVSASSFAVASKSAIGATAAVNVLTTKTTAIFAGVGNATGAFLLQAFERNVDNAVAVATAIGADMQRFLDKYTDGKYGSGDDAADKWAEDIEQGGSFENANKDANKGNQTATTINGVLNNNKGDGGTNASNSNALSTNLITSQNIKTEGTPDTSSATNEVTGNTNQAGDVEVPVAVGKKMMVAAAVAVNIVKHQAYATLSGTLTTASAEVLALNTSDFRTAATGAAAILNPLGRVKAIGAAAAVAVNANITQAILSGTVSTTHAAITDATWQNDVASAGAVQVKALFNLNGSDGFKESAAVQSVAGAATGASARMTVAGAVSVLVSKSQTIAEIADNAQVVAGEVGVSALDVSRLTALAGAVSISAQTRKGIGASFAIIYARNKVYARVGDKVDITAKELSLLAAKALVNPSAVADWTGTFGITPSNKDAHDASSSVVDGTNKGITVVDVTSTTANGDTVYNVTTTLDENELRQIFDLDAFLTQSSYYAQAMAGSGSIAGRMIAAISAAMVFAQTDVQATIGSASRIRTAGDVSLVATSDSVTRLIAGALAASISGKAVGTSVTVFDAKDTVRAAIGSDTPGAAITTITSKGATTLRAQTVGNVIAIGIAPVASVSAAAIGGTVAVVQTAQTVEAQVAGATRIDAAKDVVIAAQNNLSVLPATMSMGASASAMAVGGAFIWFDNKNETRAQVGDGAVVVSTGNVVVGALSSEVVASFLANLSASASKNSLAATINVFKTTSDTQARIGEGAQVSALKDINVQAESEAYLLSVMAQATLSASGSSLGALVNVLLFDRGITAQIAKGAQVSSYNGNIVVRAVAADYALVTGFGAALASRTDVAGTVLVIQATNRVQALVGSLVDDASGTQTLDASNTIVVADKGSIGIGSYLYTDTAALAGQLATSGSGTAVGAAVVVETISNDVRSLVGSGAALSAGGGLGGIVLPGQTTTRKGVALSAHSFEKFLIVGISGAAGQQNALTGVAGTLNVRNRVHAMVYGNASINANDDDAEGDLSISAYSTSDLQLIAGSLSVSGNKLGAGATVLVLLYNKDVRASATEVQITARNVYVEAYANDVVDVLAVSFSGSGGKVAIDAGSNVLLFENTVVSALGKVVHANAHVKVSADNSTDLASIIAVASASGKVAVSGAAAVTSFAANVSASLVPASVVNAAGAVNVQAHSTENVNMTVIGITGSGTASVSGSVAVVLTNVVASAYVGEGARVTSASLDVLAQDDYEMYGLVATAAVSGTAGVGVSAFVSISNNMLDAFIGNNAKVTCTGDIVVQAQANRSVQAYIATLAAGKVGVGGSILVSVVGGKLSQDVSDALYGGKDSSGNYKTNFDAARFTSMVNGALFGGNTAGTENDGIQNNAQLIGADTTAGILLKDRLSADSFNVGAALEGDGSYVQNTQVGHKDANGNYVFDNTNGYVSGEFSTANTDESGSIDKNNLGATADIDRTKNEDLAGVSGLFDRSDPAYTNTGAPVFSTKDSVRAYVAEGAELIGRNITIDASSLMTLDLITGSLAGGVYAAVAPGIAVGLVYANVFAYTEAGSQLRASNDVNVAAHAGSTKVSESGNAEEQTRNDALDAFVTSGEGVADIFTERGLRVVSISGAVGTVGVSAALAVLLLNSNVYAYVAGDVVQAHDVTVKASTLFPVSLAATFGVAAGGGAVNASVALVLAQGNVFAGIIGNAQVRSAQKVSVVSDTMFDATTYGTALAVGGTSGNAALSLAIDRMRIDTFVGANVSMDQVKTLEVYADAQVSANAHLLSVTGGAGFAGSLVAAVAILSPTILTYVGQTPFSEGANPEFSPAPGAGTSGATPVFNVGDVVVRNTVTTAGSSTVMTALAAGMAGISGNVLLVINDTVSYAALYRKQVNASGDITLDVYLNSSATSTGAAATIASTAIGLTTAISLLDSDNRAFIDTTGVVIRANNLSVYAGRSNKQNSSSAQATSISANAGLMSAGLNVAVADNHTKNSAHVIGSGSVWVNRAVNVHAYGVATARAVVEGANIGGMASLGGSVAVAVLRSEQLARVNSAVVHAGSLTVGAYLNNSNRAHDASYAKVVTVGLSGGVSVSMNVAVAYSRSSNTASVTADQMTIGSDDGSFGTVAVISNGSANAKAESANMSAAQLVATLVMTFAYGQATFIAELVLPAGSAAQTGAVSVTTDYVTTVLALTNPALGGVQGALVKAQANLAVAQATTKAQARIVDSALGAGTLYAHGAVVVSVTGISQARADVAGAILEIAGGSLAANYALAQVAVEQLATIKNVALFTHGGALSVTSTFNKNLAADTYGAQATVGSAATKNNVSITLIGGRASVARADMNATVRALVQNAAINTASDSATPTYGALSVLVDATSTANADVLVPKNEISGFNVTLLYTYGQARGTFEALLDLGSAASVVGTTNINTTYTSNAVSATGPAGGVSAAITNANFNYAIADAATNATAALTGTGSVVVQGALLVVAQGYGNASALGRTHKVSVSLLNVAVNVIDSYLSMNQSAYIQTTGAIVVNDLLKVASYLGDENKVLKSDASLGSSAGRDDKSYTITIVNATVNQATAWTRTKNTAYLLGDTTQGATRAQGSITAHNVIVEAKTYTNVSALAQTSWTAGLATIGSLFAEAYSYDDVRAYITLITVKATKNNVSVLAYLQANAQAESQIPGGIGLVDVATTYARAYLGYRVGESDLTIKNNVVERDTSDTNVRYQRVYAGLGTGAMIEALGDVLVQALSIGSANAYVQSGLKVSAVGKAEARIITRGYYDTLAYVGDGAQVRAGGDIVVQAQTTVKTISNILTNSIGIVVDSSKAYGVNDVVIKTFVTIGKKAQLHAGNNLVLLAQSDVTQDSQTVVNSGGGFYGTADIVAHNYLTRTVKVLIDEGAILSADFGTTSIQARAGASDNIFTSSVIPGKSSVVETGSVVTYTDITSSALVDIKPGATITNTFGTITIYADSAMKKFHNYAKASASGLGVNPDTKSFTNIALIATVTIGNANKATVFITGKNIDVQAFVSELQLIDELYSKGKALGANVDAHSHMKVIIDVDVNVNSAELRAYDNLTVKALIVPRALSYDKYHVYSYTTCVIESIGHAKAESDLSESAFSANVSLNGATLYGARVVVGSDVDLTYKGHATGSKTKGLAKLEKIHHDPQTFTSNTSFTNVNFYLGDAAAGIVVDVSGTDDYPLVRTVGIKGDRVIWSKQGTSLVFETIVNPLPGSLSVSGNSSGSYKVYDQRYLPAVTIINRTDLHLVLGAITTENANYLNPTVNGRSVQMLASAHQPVICVESRGMGNVTLSGLIANPRGTVAFVWTDKERAGRMLASREMLTTLGVQINVAPVWAHVFTVKNAQAIGIDEAGAVVRFNVYATWLDNQKPKVQVQASGDVYLGYTDLRILDKLYLGSAQGGVSVDVANIVGGATTDVLVHTALTFYRDPESTLMTMPVPGSVEFVESGVEHLTSNVTLDLEKLTPYWTGFNVIDATNQYLLPNGTIIFTDEFGIVTRIVEGGVDVHVASYELEKRNGNLYATIAEGVRVNLTTGQLEVDEGTAFDVLLSALHGDWFMKAVKEGLIKFVIVEDTLQDGTVVTSQDKICTIEALWSVGTEDSAVTYYQLTAPGYKLSDAFGENPKETFMLAYSKGSNTIVVYRLEGATTQTGVSVSDSINYGTSITITKDGKTETVAVFKDMRGYLEDKGILSEIWNNTDGIFLGYLVADGSAQGQFIYVPRYIEVPNFLGGSSSVFYNISDGLFYSKKSINNNGTFTLQYFVLSAVVSTDLGGGNRRYYVDPTKVAADTENLALYSTLINKIWQTSYSHTMQTDVGIVGQNGSNGKPTEHTWPVSSGDAYAGRNDVHVNNYRGMIPFAYNVGGSSYQWFYETLYDHSLSIQYYTLAAASLGLMPFTSEDDATMQYAAYVREIDYDENGKPLPATLSLVGAIEGVQIRFGTLPSDTVLATSTSSKQGYQITDTMYVAADGTFYFFGANGYQAYVVPGDTNSKFQSSYLETTVDKSATPTFSNIILRANQDVRLELLTQAVKDDDGYRYAQVARSVSGAYYILVQDTWKVATKSATVSETGLEKVIDGVSYAVWKQSYSITYGGYTYLTANYYYLAGTAATSDNLLIIEFELGNGVVVDSDGNVGMPEGVQQDWQYQEHFGSIYNLTSLVGQTLVVTIEDTGATGQDGVTHIPAQVVNGASTTPSLTGDNITIIIPAQTQVGSNQSPLTTTPFTPGGTVQLDFLELGKQDGQSIVVGNVVMGSTDSVTIAAGLVVAPGASFTQSAALDIIYTTIEVKGSGALAGKLTLTAGRDIIGTWQDGTTQQQPGWLKLGSGTSAVLTAGNNQVYQAFEVGEGATLQAFASGTYTGSVGTTQGTGNMHGGTVVVLSDAKARLDAVDANTFETAQVAGTGTLYLQGIGAIEGGMLQGDAGASITLSSKGNINNTQHYLLVDLPEGTPLQIELAASYYLQGYDPQAPTGQSAGRDEHGSTASGTTLGDGGSQDILLDIVGSDADELAAWIVARLSDRDGVLSGAHVDEAALKALFESLIKANDPRITAAWLAQVIGDEAWSEQRIQAVLDALRASGSAGGTGGAGAGAGTSAGMGTGGTGAGTGAGVGAGTGTGSGNPSGEAGNTGAPADTLDQVVQAFFVALTAQEPLLDEQGNPITNAQGIPTMRYTLSDDLFADVLALFIDEGLYTDATLLGFVQTLATAEDIAQALENVWQQAQYPTNTPDDPRGLSVQVGTSTASAFVKNRGDITIVQASGNMTIGNVVSERGIVTLKTTDAAAGNMVADPTERIHVQAAQVIFHATGSVGTSLAPLVMQTGAVDTLVVGNVAFPLPAQDPSGSTTFPNATVVWNPQTKTFQVQAGINYTWIGTWDAQATGAITGVAAGDMTLAEASGSLGVDTLEAGGTVVLFAAGDVLDVRENAQVKPNIAATGATINTTAGSIGAPNKPLTFDTNAEGGNALTNTLNASAPGNITVQEVAGNMMAGAISAGGNVVISVPNGALMDADLLDKTTMLQQLLAQAKAAEAAAASTEEAAKIREDTLARLHAALVSAQDAYDKALANKQAADDQAQKATDVADALQPIKDAIDVARKDAVQAQTNYEQALATYTALKQAYEDLLKDGSATPEALAAAEQRAKDAESQALLAKQAWQDAQQALQAAREAAALVLGVTMPADPSQIDTLLGETYAAAQKQALAAQQQAASMDAAYQQALQSKNAAQNAYDALKREYDALLQTAIDKKAQAQQLRDDYDVLAAQQTTPAVSAAGDVTIVAQAVGAVDTAGVNNALSTQVGGVLFVDVANAATGAPGVIAVENAGNLTLAPLEGSLVSVVATGTITALNSGDTPDIIADRLVVGSTDADVGLKTDPLYVRTQELSAYGKNVYIRGDGNTVIDAIVAENEVILGTDGDITGKPSIPTNDKVHLVAPRVELHAEGDIGTSAQSLVVHANNLLTTSNNIYLQSQAPQVHIEGITAKGDAHLRAEGHVHGGIITAQNIDLEATGFVGERQNPVIINVPGNVRVVSTYQQAYWYNLHQSNNLQPVPADGSNTQNAGNASYAGGANGGVAGLAQTGDTTGAAALALVLLGLVALACAAGVLRHRKRNLCP